MENEIKLQRIDRPNLILAITLSFIVLMGDLLYTRFAKYLLGIDLPVSYIFIPLSILYIISLFFLTEYLKAFELKMVRLILYTLIFVLVAQLAINILNTYLIKEANYQLLGFTNLITTLMRLFRVLLYAVIGVNLLKFKDDFVGGLNVLAVASFICCLTIITGIIQYYYYTLAITYTIDFSPFDNPLLILMMVITDIFPMTFTIATIYIYIRAYRHNKRVGEEQDKYISRQ